MVSGLLDTISGYVPVAKNYASVGKSTIKTFLNKRKIAQKLINNLPITLMGQKNSGVAGEKIKELVDKGNYSGARNYVKSQLKKILEQTSGNEYVKKKLKGYND